MDATAEVIPVAGGQVVQPMAVPNPADECALPGTAGADGAGDAATATCAFPTLTAAAAAAVAPEAFTAAVEPASAAATPLGAPTLAIRTPAATTTTSSKPMFQSRLSFVGKPQRAPAPPPPPTVDKKKASGPEVPGANAPALAAAAATTTSVVPPSVKAPRKLKKALAEPLDPSAPTTSGGGASATAAAAPEKAPRKKRAGKTAKQAHPAVPPADVVPVDVPLASSNVVPTALAPAVPTVPPHAVPPSPSHAVPPPIPPDAQPGVVTHDVLPMPSDTVPPALPPVPLDDVPHASSDVIPPAVDAAPGLPPPQQLHSDECCVTIDVSNRSAAGDRTLQLAPQLGSTSPLAVAEPQTLPPPLPQSAGEGVSQAAPAVPGISAFSVSSAFQASLTAGTLTVPAAPQPPSGGRGEAAVANASPVKAAPLAVGVGTPSEELTVPQLPSCWRDETAVASALPARAATFADGVATTPAEGVAATPADGVAANPAAPAPQPTCGGHAGAASVRVPPATASTREPLDTPQDGAVVALTVQSVVPPETAVTHEVPHPTSQAAAVSPEVPASPQVTAEPSTTVTATYAPVAAEAPSSPATAVRAAESSLQPGNAPVATTLGTGDEGPAPPLSGHVEPPAARPELTVVAAAVEQTTQPASAIDRCAEAPGLVEHCEHPDVPLSVESHLPAASDAQPLCSMSTGAAAVAAAAAADIVGAAAATDAASAALLGQSADALLHRDAACVVSDHQPAPSSMTAASRSAARHTAADVRSVAAADGAAAAIDQQALASAQPPTDVEADPPLTVALPSRLLPAVAGQSVFHGPAGVSQVVVLMNLEPEVAVASAVREVVVASVAPEAVVESAVPEMAVASAVPEAVGASLAPEAVLESTVPEVAVASAVPEAVRANIAPEAVVESAEPEVAVASAVPEAVRANIAPEAAVASAVPEVAVAIAVPGVSAASVEPVAAGASALPTPDLPTGRQSRLRLKKNDVKPAATAKKVQSGAVTATLEPVPPPFSKGDSCAAHASASSLGLGGTSIAALAAAAGAAAVAARGAAGVSSNGVAAAATAATAATAAAPAVAKAACLASVAPTAQLLPLAPPLRSASPVRLSQATLTSSLTLSPARAAAPPGELRPVLPAAETLAAVASPLRPPAPVPKKRGGAAAAGRGRGRGRRQVTFPQADPPPLQESPSHVAEDMSHSLPLPAACQPQPATVATAASAAAVADDAPIELDMSPQRGGRRPAKPKVSVPPDANIAPVEAATEAAGRKGRKSKPPSASPATHKHRSKAPRVASGFPPSETRGTPERDRRDAGGTGGTLAGQAGGAAAAGLADVVDLSLLSSPPQSVAPSRAAATVTDSPTKAVAGSKQDVKENRPLHDAVVAPAAGKPKTACALFLPVEERKRRRQQELKEAKAAADAAAAAASREHAELASVVPSLAVMTAAEATAAAGARHQAGEARRAVQGSSNPSSQPQHPFFMARQKQASAAQGRDGQPSSTAGPAGCRGSASGRAPLAPVHVRQLAAGGQLAGQQAGHDSPPGPFEVLKAAAQRRCEHEHEVTVRGDVLAGSGVDLGSAGACVLPGGDSVDDVGQRDGREAERCTADYWQPYDARACLRLMEPPASATFAAATYGDAAVLGCDSALLNDAARREAAATPCVLEQYVESLMAQQQRDAGDGAELMDLPSRSDVTKELQAAVARYHEVAVANAADASAGTSTATTITSVPPSRLVPPPGKRDGPRRPLPHGGNAVLGEGEYGEAGLGVPVPLAPPSRAGATAAAAADVASTGRTLLWSHKYAPRSAEQVCGNAEPMQKLQAWLSGWRDNIENKAEAHDAPGHEASPAAARRGRHGGRRSRRCRQLRSSDDEDSASGGRSSSDDFLSTAGDSSDYNSEASSGSGSSSRRRGGRGDGERSLAATRHGLPTAVVLCGPCGVGKTAAVFACAQGLGYRVLEVNPGMDRAAGALMRQVGEATRSRRLVHLAPSLAGHAQTASRQQRAPRQSCTPVGKGQATAAEGAKLATTAGNEGAAVEKAGLARPKRAVGKRTAAGPSGDEGDVDIDGGGRSGKGAVIGKRKGQGDVEGDGGGGGKGATTGRRRAAKSLGGAVQAGIAEKGLPPLPAAATGRVDGRKRAAAVIASPKHPKKKPTAAGALTAFFTPSAATAAAAAAIAAAAAAPVSVPSPASAVVAESAGAGTTPIASLATQDGCSMGDVEAELVLMPRDCQPIEIDVCGSPPAAAAASVRSSPRLPGVERKSDGLLDTAAAIAEPPATASVSAALGVCRDAVEGIQGNLICGVANGQRDALLAPSTGQRRRDVSLVLFDEVDVLSERDNGFLAAVGALITDSRRPIVLTMSGDEPLPAALAELEPLVLPFARPATSDVLRALVLSAAAEQEGRRADGFSGAGCPADLPLLQAVASETRGDLRRAMSALQLCCMARPSAAVTTPLEPTGCTTLPHTSMPATSEAAVIIAAADVSAAAPHLPTPKVQTTVQVRRPACAALPSLLAATSAPAAVTWLQPGGTAERDVLNAIGAADRSVTALCEAEGAAQIATGLTASLFSKLLTRRAGQPGGSTDVSAKPSLTLPDATACQSRALSLPPLLSLGFDVASLPSSSSSALPPPSLCGWQRVLQSITARGATLSSVCGTVRQLSACVPPPTADGDAATVDGGGLVVDVGSCVTSGSAEAHLGLGGALFSSGTSDLRAAARRDELLRYDESCRNWEAKLMLRRWQDADESYCPPAAVLRRGGRAKGGGGRAAAAACVDSGYAGGASVPPTAAEELINGHTEQSAAGEQSAACDAHDAGDAAPNPAVGDSGMAIDVPPSGGSIPGPLPDMAVDVLLLGSTPGLPDMAEDAPAGVPALESNDDVGASAMEGVNVVPPLSPNGPACAASGDDVCHVLQPCPTTDMSRSPQPCPASLNDDAPACAAAAASICDDTSAARSPGQGMLAEPVRHETSSQQGVMNVACIATRQPDHVGASKDAGGEAATSQRVQAPLGSEEGAASEPGQGPSSQRLVDAERQAEEPTGMLESASRTVLPLADLLPSAHDVGAPPSADVPSADAVEVPADAVAVDEEPYPIMPPLPPISPWLLAFSDAPATSAGGKVPPELQPVLLDCAGLAAVAALCDCLSTLDVLSAPRDACVPLAGPYGSSRHHAATLMSRQCRVGECLAALGDKEDPFTRELAAACDGLGCSSSEADAYCQCSACCSVAAASLRVADAGGSGWGNGVAEALRNLEEFDCLGRDSGEPRQMPGSEIASLAQQAACAAAGAAHRLVVRSLSVLPDIGHMHSCGGVSTAGAASAATAAAGSLGSDAVFGGSGSSARDATASTAGGHVPHARRCMVRPASSVLLRLCPATAVAGGTHAAQDRLAAACRIAALEAHRRSLCHNSVAQRRVRRPALFEHRLLEACPGLGEQALVVLGELGCYGGQLDSTRMRLVG